MTGSSLAVVPTGEESDFRRKYGGWAAKVRQRAAPRVESFGTWRTITRRIASYPPELNKRLPVQSEQKDDTRAKKYNILYTLNSPLPLSSSEEVPEIRIRRAAEQRQARSF